MPFTVLKPKISTSDNLFEKCFCFEPSKGITSNFLTELFCLQLFKNTPGIQPLARVKYNKTLLNCTFVFQKWKVSLDKLLIHKDVTFTERVELALCLEKQILPVLQKLHQNGILHCDVCPRNLLVDRKNREFRLIDFDCARWIIEPSLSIQTRFSNQFLKKGLTNQEIDYFGLAVTMLYLLSDTPENFSWQDTLAQVQDLKKPSPSLSLCKYKISCLLSMSSQKNTYSSTAIFLSGSQRFLQKQHFVETAFYGEKLSRTLRYFLMSQLYRLEMEQKKNNLDPFLLASNLKNLNEKMFGTAQDTCQSLISELSLLEQLNFQIAI